MGERNANQFLTRAGYMIRRAEREGLGRNGEATRRAIRAYLGRANRELLAREDEGEDVAALSRRYFHWRDRAALAGLV